MTLPFATSTLLPWTILLLALSLSLRFLRYQLFLEAASPCFCLSTVVLTVRNVFYLAHMWRSFNFLVWPFVILLLLAAVESVYLSSSMAQNGKYRSVRFWLCLFSGCFLGWLSMKFGVAAAPLRAAVEVGSGTMLLISLVTLILTLTFALNRFSTQGIIERQFGLLIYLIGVLISSRLPAEARQSWSWWNATLTTEILTLLALLLFHHSWPQGSRSAFHGIHKAPRAGKPRSSYHLEYKPFLPTPRRIDPRS